MPHSRAATSTAGSILPSGRGGEHSTTSGQPARRAGMPSISTVDGNGALPAGTYRPTRPIGRTTRSHSTPGAVSAAYGRCIQTGGASRRGIVCRYVEYQLVGALLEKIHKYHSLR